MADLKLVYRAKTLEAAASQDDVKKKLGGQYPIAIKSWSNKWVILSAYFKYPYYIRKAICTTNAIEAVHRQFRTLTKTKGDFMNENSMLKLLCAHIFRLEKWTM